MGIDLLKKKVGIVLEKRKLSKVICEVKFALDISGSMQSLYQNGTVQNLTDRLLAIASQFDDNGQMEVWTFSSGFDQAPTIDENMHENYIQNHILRNNSIEKWGGTNYAPVMQDILNDSFGGNFLTEAIATIKVPSFIGKLFGKKDEVVNSTKTVVAYTKSSKYPIFVPFITDGENYDTGETERLIQNCLDRNIYWMMVGIGGAQFSWLKQMANKYPNVGFMSVNDLSRISDEDFFEQMLNTEFCDWVKKF
jgi:hypothetical protein